MILPGGTLLQGGKYKIEEKIGQGSFGITYLAEHTSLGKKVAIKEFFMKELNSRGADGSITGMSDGSLSYNYAQKFKKEALNLSRLEHPNIVRVTDSFEENGTFYYVMDYIEGQNLNDYLKDRKVSGSEAVAIIKEVANALVYMHDEKHMLHLDLKPGNIMRRKSDGHIFLIDFGLSKHFSNDGQPETSTTIGLGTAGYAPVEQSNQPKNGEFRPTIDVYALGATLYKLLTGQTPPVASDLVSDDELLAESLAKYNVQVALVSVIEKAMMPSVKKRTQSILAFIDSLPNIDDVDSSTTATNTVETEISSDSFISNKRNEIIKKFEYPSTNNEYISFQNPEDTLIAKNAQPLHLLKMNDFLKLGRYRIMRSLSSSTFGNTYEALDTVKKNRVAIKEFYVRDFNKRDKLANDVILLSQDHREIVDRLRLMFKKEAEVGYQMRHEHLIPVLEFFEENNTIYYVMEYIDGRDLSDILRTQGPFQESVALDIVHQVADALKYMHSINKLHLNVKPSNIIIDGNSKVFLSPSGANEQYEGLFTAGYSPVEQFASKFSLLSPETDIYALGATLYKLLTGNTPPEPTEIISNGIPELPSSVSKATKDLIKWAMQLNKKDRPHSCDEFLNALPSNVEDNLTGHKSRKKDDDATISIDSEETTYIHDKENTENIVDQKKEEVNEIVEDHKVHENTQSGRSNKYLIAAIVGIIAIIGVFSVVGVVNQYRNSLNNSLDSEDLIQIEHDASYSNGILYVDSVTYDMVKVEEGTFTMGATVEMKGAYDVEKPTHKVSLSCYYIGKTEVTQALWKAVMGNNPSTFKGDNRPVENVSWYDCKNFISKLNSITGQNFRLPTEAEWEFAARGGNKTKRYRYSGSNKLGNVAWYDGNSEKKTHPVATKKPNELGIYDMSGNVWEWCSDLYGDYSNRAQINPSGPNSGFTRVRRGGGWISEAGICHSSCRGTRGADNSFNSMGFRLVLSE